MRAAADGDMGGAIDLEPGHDAPAWALAAILRRTLGRLSGRRRFAVR
jgi:hypothetical protein